MTQRICSERGCDQPALDLEARICRPCLLGLVRDPYRPTLETLAHELHALDSYHGDWAELLKPRIAVIAGLALEVHRLLSGGAA